jgi:hypothetical protein
LLLIFIAFSFSPPKVISILSSFDYHWPSKTQEALFFTWFTNFNSDFLASECTFSVSFAVKYSLFLAMPIFLMFSISLRYLFFLLQSKILQRYGNSLRTKFACVLTETESAFSLFKKAVAWLITDKPAERISQIRQETLNICATLLTTVYLFAASLSLSFFDCVDRGDGLWTLKRNPEFECYSTDWFALLPGSKIERNLFVFFSIC